MTRIQPIPFQALRQRFASHDKPEACEIWAEDWLRSEAAIPQAPADFLDRNALAPQAAFCRVEGQACDAVLAVADDIRDDPILLRLAWHVHFMLSLVDEPQDQKAWSWPLPTPQHTDVSGLFYAVVVLAGVERVRGMHQRMGVDVDITRDTLYDLAIWLRDGQRWYGRWMFRSIYWLALHLQGRLYRLGRLQFEHATWRERCSLWRHDASGRVVALSDAGVRWRGDGQFADADGGARPPALANAPDTPPDWTAPFEQTHDAVRACVIDPRGYARREPVTLKLPAWRCVLRQGDPTLGVHIPADGPMEHQACGESLAAAPTFFARHLPQATPIAFQSGSWLFDPQLADVLPAPSNIVRFQREFFLLPMPGANANQTLERVFNVPDGKIDPATAPRDTSLQRAVLDHLHAGGAWRAGAMALLIDDLAWGEQPYFTRADEPLPDAQ